MLKLLRNTHLKSVTSHFRSSVEKTICRGLLSKCPTALPMGRFCINSLNILSFRLTGYVNSTNRLYSSCWKCDNSVNEVDFFCGKCKVILKLPSSVDYYKLFDISDGYLIDELELTRSYRKIQMVLHPDKFSLASPVR